MIYFPDVSYYDARRWTITGWVYDQAMDWSSYDIAMMKCSEGTVEDKGFRLNWTAARGRKRVAYHFFRPTVNAIVQANFVRDLLARDWTENDELALDIEVLDGVSPSLVLAFIGSFLYETEKWLPASRIYLYLNYPFWKQIGGFGATWAKKYGLHLAQYSLDNWLAPKLWDDESFAWLKEQIESGEIAPMEVPPWGKPDRWQFTARMDTKFLEGHPGIKKAADMNCQVGDVVSPTEPQELTLEEKVQILWEDYLART